MNRSQRWVALVAAGAFLLVNLFPPWLAEYHQSKPLLRWALLFDPPGFAGTRIDWMTLSFEWLVLFIAGGFLLWSFRSPNAASGVAATYQSAAASQGGDGD
jgi:hypothetical protein